MEEKGIYVSLLAVNRNQKKNNVGEGREKGG